MYHSCSLLHHGSFVFNYCVYSANQYFSESNIYTLQDAFHQTNDCTYEYSFFVTFLYNVVCIIDVIFIHYGYQNKIKNLKMNQYLSLSLSLSLSINAGYPTSNHNSPWMFLRKNRLKKLSNTKSLYVNNPVKLKPQWVKIIPLADVSSSINTETGVVLIYISTYFFFDISVGFFLKIAVSIKAREIHSKRGQSWYYVGVAQVSFRYIFLLVCYRNPMTFWNTHSGRCPSWLSQNVISVSDVISKILQE